MLLKQHFVWTTRAKALLTYSVFYLKSFLLALAIANWPIKVWRLPRICKPLTKLLTELCIYSTTPIIRTLLPGLTLDFKDENSCRSVLAFLGNSLKRLQWWFLSFDISNFSQNYNTFLLNQMEIVSHWFKLSEHFSSSE